MALWEAKTLLKNSFLSFCPSDRCTEEAGKSENRRFDYEL